MAPVATALMALGPNWLDPVVLLDGVGVWALVIVGGMLFAECGLLVGFFLPGDSLLFTAGLFVASGALDVPLWILIAVAVVTAIAGNLVGYWIGAKAGPAIFNRPDSRLFRQEYVDRTAAFFDRYGAGAVVLARFVPIVRTFITVMAGVGRMSYRRYAGYSAIGALAWGAGVTVLGYFLGQIAIIRNNVDLIFILIIALSVVPIFLALWRGRGRSAPGTGEANEAAPTNASDIRPS